ncbi:hypothetical protein [Massilia sp. 9096]|uniref:hypothetical protein n=1 Tax=Massilia sp. 9096 TaxID=1500894 RepID=UPI0012E05A13|nr:hypothetical protein [Massilia sp. 9096]
MAPIVAALVRYGFCLIASAAMVKGTGWVEEKTGVKLDENKTALSSEDKDKLLQFQLEHEEKLLKLQLENNKLGLEKTKAYLADVQNARSEIRQC